MEFEEDEVWAPVSPSAQYLKSSSLSLTILGVLEIEVPFDDSMTMYLLEHVFLPINPRFSSVMVTGENGTKKWKKVRVDLRQHVRVPVFSSDMSVDYYDECFTDYLSNLAMEPLPETQPLWELHILKYPTRNAAGNIVFKLHHSLGDGYSLMGALLSCLQRLDDPSMPLTLPTRQPNAVVRPNVRRVPRFLKGLFNTARDFGCSLLKSGVVKDDKSPIRSGGDRVEFRPIVTTTITIGVDQIKLIKNKLNVSINDVITGIITLGTRLYMQKTNDESGKSASTALVLLNTRAVGGYKSVDEMVKPGSDTPWGNRFAFLQVPLPKLTDRDEIQKNPLGFVRKAHRTIKRQRNSAAVYLTGQFLNLIRKLRGPEATSRYIHGTLKNTSMAVSNLVGPVEKMSLADQPVKGLYFVVAGAPQSLSVTMISYVGKLRIAMSMEKGLMDPNKFKSCIEHAFDIISKAALLPSPATT